MINKALGQISLADIEKFVHERWPEGKTVDYKRDAYGTKDDDKKELLKDVSSFANTQGGDIIIGVAEAAGLPTEIVGIEPADVDAEKLRMEAIIRNGLEPRADVAIHHAAMPAGRAVIIVRVRESLVGPHRVVYQGKFGEFWARSSAGKFSMDTNELRRAFTVSESVGEQIRAFRRDRVAQIMSGETPVPLSGLGALILHLIPVASFRSTLRFEVASLPGLPVQFPPMGTSGWDHRFNLDGHLTAC
jgi:hypothetical protein